MPLLLLLLLFSVLLLLLLLLFEQAKFQCYLFISLLAHFQCSALLFGTWTNFYQLFTSVCLSFTTIATIYLFHCHFFSVFKRYTDLTIIENTVNGQIHEQRRVDPIIRQTVSAISNITSLSSFFHTFAHLTSRVTNLIDAYGRDFMTFLANIKLKILLFRNSQMNIWQTAFKWCVCIYFTKCMRLIYEHTKHLIRK